jgi:ABC-type antimicrobial peptide transport system permease subunit
MTILEGRDFSPEHTDSLSVLMNEAAVKYMELEDPIGSILTGDDVKATVIGVVKDVIMTGPADAVTPTLFVFNHDKKASETIIRLPKGREKEAIAGIGELFKQRAPDAIFNWYYTSDVYSWRFSDMDRTGKFINIFAFLAIFISCLGLFGLAAFTAERRTKEIGIRKVLGASVPGLITLLSKEFAVLVVIAFAIAGPLSLWQANSMLSEYEYHINVEWWVLPATGLGALLLAVITVGAQAFRAAKSNPVESLKTE